MTNFSSVLRGCSNTDVGVLNNPWIDLRQIWWGTLSDDLYTDLKNGEDI